MTPAADRYIAELLQLPPTERGEVAARLIDSLDPPTDAEAEAAWSEEIRKRIDEIQSGRVAAVPWKEARTQILADGDGGP
jgi:putative addiction module component (TIGR02574 family)